MSTVIRQYFALFIHYLKPQWLQVLLMAVTMFLGIAQSLYSPQIIKRFIDQAASGADLLTLILLAGLYIGVALIGQVFTVATNYFSSKVAWTATNRLRYDLMRHCLSLDMSYHKVHTPGEMIERIDGDARQFANFFSQFAVVICTQSIMVIAVLVLLYSISWMIGAIMTMFVIFAFLLLNYLRRHTIALALQNREVATEYTGFLGERLEGTADIRANGAIAYTMYRFLLLLRRLWSVTIGITRLFQFQFTGLVFLFGCGTLIILGVGAYQWSAHLITIGTVYTILSYSNRLSSPVQQLQAHIQDIQQVEASFRRINQLLHTTSTLKEGPGCALSNGPYTVAFDHVTFGYTPETPVLSDLTFACAPGKVLGILGRTGSGKTTIARLLFRLYDPQQGEITLDGIPIHQAQLYELRHRIGMVTQDVQLFHASIRDNLTFFDASIPDARIVHALEDIGLEDWFRQFPDGLDTLLGSKGDGLSAGQAQLLACARVFLHDPGLIILDEASSRLDPITEALIEAAIDRMLTNRTAIIIAHRLGTLRRADTILILEDGRLQEYGERTALLQEPTSRFSQLLQAGLEKTLV